MSLKEQVDNIRLLITNNDWHENKNSEELVMKLLSDYYTEFDSSKNINQEYFKDNTYHVFDIIHKTFGYKVDEEFEDILQEAKSDDQKDEYIKDYKKIKGLLNNLEYIKNNIYNIDIDKCSKEMTEAMESVKEFLYEIKKGNEELIDTMNEMSNTLKNLGDSLKSFSEMVEKNPSNHNNKLI
jgi:DNA-binding ferritin-like protein